MKKIVLGLILLFVFTGNAWGLTGYEWQKYSNEWKTLFIAGFLVGYNSGQIDGRLKILGDVKDTFTASGKKCKLCVEDFNFKMMIITQIPLVTIFDENKHKNIGYYKNEIDSFFTTYPLCKGKDFRFILGQLAKVWTNKDFLKKPLTYEKVGEDCLK